MSISFWFSGNILLHVREAAAHPRDGDLVRIHTDNCKAAFWVVSLEWEYRQGDKSETELHIFLRST